MARYRLTPEAEQDLREIRSYIARRDSRKAAARVLRTIKLKLDQIARNPGIGHARADLTSRELLFFRVYRYVIIYRPRTHPLEVVAIPSGHQDIESLLAVPRIE